MQPAGSSPSALIGKLYRRLKSVIPTRGRMLLVRPQSRVRNKISATTFLSPPLSTLDANPRIHLPEFSGPAAL